MASQYYITSLFKVNGDVSSKVSSSGLMKQVSLNSHFFKSSKTCTRHVSSATLYTNTKKIGREGLVIRRVDVNTIIDELKVSTRRELMRSSNPTTTLTLIDSIQRLGIGYHFEEEINETLINLPRFLPDEDDLYTTALYFRLQRHNSIHTSPADVFHKFMDANGKVKTSLCDDIQGLLSLYEASNLGANAEEFLSHAKEFTKRHLHESISRLSNPKLHKKVVQSLELPRHMRMERLEARRYIEEYGNEEDHDPIVLEFAKLDYNHVQSLFHKELVEITT